MKLNSLATSIEFSTQHHMINSVNYIFIVDLTVVNILKSTLEATKNSKIEEGKTRG